MTRSKMARRRARQNSNLSVPYARMRPMSNWVVGSQALTSAGQVIGGVATPTSLPTWAPALTTASYLLSSGTPITFQAAVIQPGISGNAPTIGRMRIDELKGKILFSPTAAGYFQFAVGVYVSEFTLNTSAWDVYDPLNSADASRDDWWFLDAKTFFCGAPAGALSPVPMELDISFKSSIVIGGGQALNVTVSMISSTTCYANPAFRTRVGPVA